MNVIHQILDQPFDLLASSKSRLFLSVFCGSFAALFLYIFNPFNSLTWEYDLPIAQLIGIWSAGLLAIPVMMFSQFVLRKYLFPSKFKRKHWLLQIMIELLLMSGLFFLIFGDKNPIGEAYFSELIGVFKHTFQLAVLPYAVGMLMLKVYYQDKEVKVTSRILPNVNASMPRMVELKDEKDKLDLTLNLDHLLYFKSEDNYTSIHYLHKGEVQKSLIRTNLKKLGQELKEYPVLRVHRSYMVNMEKLVSIEREGKGYQLQLYALDKQTIPVSGSYKEAFEQFREGVIGSSFTPHS